MQITLPTVTEVHGVDLLRVPEGISAILKTKNKTKNMLFFMFGGLYLRNPLSNMADILTTMSTIMYTICPEVFSLIG